MRTCRSSLPSLLLLVVFAAPAAALSPPELLAGVSPQPPSSADLVRVTIHHLPLSCLLLPIDVAVTEAPAGAEEDYLVRVRLARENGQFVCLETPGPSLAIGPLAPGDYRVQVAWEDQSRDLAGFGVRGEPPLREGSGPFARPLPWPPGAHEVVIEDVPGLAGCSTRSFELRGTDVEGSLIHVYFAERYRDPTCAGLAEPGAVRTVVGPLPFGTWTTAVVWFVQDVSVVPEPAVLWGTAPLIGTAVDADCAVGGNELCLDGGRFRIRAGWRAGPDVGAGRPVPLTRDSGSFWFFDRDNLELTVKVLDACEPFGRHWVFLSGLTDVEVEIEVVDTATGARRTYRNEAGEAFQPIFDTDAFTCP